MGLTRGRVGKGAGRGRGQAALLPAAIEDYVAADAQVRVMDAFL